MRKFSFLPLASLALIFTSCSNSEQANQDESVTEVQTEEVAEEASLNVDSLVTFINGKRGELEAADVQPTEISTAEFRAKIKQKWSKIHVYDLGNAIRIKTYPHASVSARTEEFYAVDGNLVMVAIEDNGEGDRGKSAESIDKLYYFHMGELIKEVKSGNEVEFSVGDSDGAELLSEFAEYVKIFKGE